MQCNKKPDKNIMIIFLAGAMEARGFQYIKEVFDCCFFFVISLPTVTHVRAFASSLHI